MVNSSCGGRIFFGFRFHRPGIARAPRAGQRQKARHRQFALDLEHLALATEKAGTGGEQVVLLGGVRWILRRAIAPRGWTDWGKASRQDLFLEPVSKRRLH